MDSETKQEVRKHLAKWSNHLVSMSESVRLRLEEAEAKVEDELRDELKSAMEELDNLEEFVREEVDDPDDEENMLNAVEKARGKSEAYASAVGKTMDDAWNAYDNWNSRAMKHENDVRDEFDID